MERPALRLHAETGRRRVLAATLGAALAGLSRTARSETPPLQIGYLRWLEPRQTISLLDKPAPDNGLAGAKLATADNNTTGRFIGQQFALADAPVRAGDDPVALLSGLVDSGAVLVLSDLPGDRLLALADAGRAKQVVLFNIAAPDDALRQQDCRSDVIHVAPSRSMLADALAQYLVWKKWSRWVLVYGSHPEDALLAEAYRRTARRFGAKIVKEREFKDAGGARQTDSGVVQTQQQMPVFTQGLPDYDVLVAADENAVFADYLPFRTWDARPVAGSAGLRPVTWDPGSESWGGTQLQDRFVRMAHRRMTELDMQAWTACRMIGEAASRAGSVEPAKIMQDMRGGDFGVAAYKGQKLTLRDWDWQLRQPILLSDGRTVVSISPQPGFLHQVNTLDTLGFDRPETKCKLQ
ncbi:MAG TPA: ABC transporter substrate-binding protein [Acetobacteraceae bacterium]|jgi:ABC transporter substrate binding protein (PQQ-dependent alcohol dehydrogenase system)|nr:ABC transporter substrate-binding protein [Acetobacteraceae bacterium]